MLLDQGVNVWSGTMTSLDSTLAEQGDHLIDSLIIHWWLFSRQTADLFAEAGYLVVMPDFYRGSWKDPSSPDVVQFLKDQTQWSKLKLDLDNIVMPFAKNKGWTIIVSLTLINILQQVQHHSQLWEHVGAVTWCWENVPMMGWDKKYCWTKIFFLL